MSANTFWSGPGHPTEAEGRPEKASRAPLPGQGEPNGEAVHAAAADVLPPANLQPPTAQTFKDLEIPDDFRLAVEKELSGDEKMLWVGRPSRNSQAHPRNPMLPWIGMGLLALAGVLFLTCLVSAVATRFGAGQASGCFFSVILAGVGGVLLLISKADPSKSCRFCYVVTNRRAMILEVSLWRRGPAAQNYLPQQLLGLERRDNAEVSGAGDLIFEYVLTLPGNSVNPLTGSFLQQGPSVGLSNAPQRVPRGFLWLDQVREVEDLIRTTLLLPLEQALDAPRSAAGGRGALRRPAQAASVACACGATIEAPPASAGKWAQCPRCAAAVPTARREVDAGAAGPCREDGSVPADLKAKALAGLDGNERPAWVGQPVSKLLLLRSAGYFAVSGAGILLALLWLVVTLAPPKAPAPRLQRGKQVAAAPAKQEAGNSLLPVGLFFLSACVSAVPLLRWRTARRTCYALTNRRALVYKEGLFGPTRESYSPLEVSAMRRSDSWLAAGSGDLIFQTVQVVSTSRTRGVSSTSVKTTHYGFLAVAQIGEVEKLVRETLIDRFVDKLNQASAL